METEHLNHDCSTLPNLALNSDITNELLLDSEIRSNTKTILENVCNDFESIDVLSSKENKFVLLKKWKPPGSFSECSNDGNDIANVTLDRNAECAPAESVFISNAVSRQNDSLQNSTHDENTLNSQITTAIVVPSLNSQNEASSDIVNSVKNTRTEMVPLQDPSKVGILSDNFANDKNLSSSLAELADAEIVQTSENAVSIIISNPRFIQVLNCKDSGLPSDTSDITLNSNCIVSEKENLNEVIVDGSAPVSNYNLHEVSTEKDPHTEVANEIIYSEGEEIYNFAHTHTSTPNTLHSKEKNRPYYRSRADLGKVAATRARRITAKMKNEWTRVLEEKGFLVCPLSGCFQKYRTMANFQTHYKYCYSGMEKDLKHCPYCASVIFSSHKAVLHHMKVEHPEKLEEYKTNFPQPEDVYDCFEDENSRLVEISQKSLKNHKRKFNMAKENRLSPKKRILKNKIKTIHQPVIENSQLRECGRFDEIVSKISSVNKTQSAERDENKLSKEHRKRKLILTGHVVTAEKYFEDERDGDEIIDMPVEKETEEKEKVNTKSRLVLNMDRYKRYTQYLTVTRDFGSHRRTYSRPKSSNVLDSSQLVTLHNDSSELDIHQLNSSLESSSISLSENDTLCLTNNNNSDLCCVSPEISAFDPLQSETSILNKIHLDSKAKRNSVVNCETETEREIDSLKINGPNDLIKEKIPCYKAQISIIPTPKTEVVPSRKPPLKISPIITYGKIPDSISALKSDRPPAVDFDSLVKNSANTKKLNSVGNMHVPPSVEKSKHNKEDGIKHPQRSDSSIAPVKRKRGRPRKDSAVGEREPFCKNLEKTKMIPENLHTQKYTKALKKPGNLKKGNKTYSKKCRKIAKNSKVTVKKISSKMHSKLLQKKRMKISAKSSLKKAIMCGVKVFKREKRKRGRPPRVCIKSLLKNTKFDLCVEKQKKRENRECIYMTPLKSSNSDHNYFSSLRICESQENSLCNSVCVRESKEQPSVCEKHDTIVGKEDNLNISLPLPSKEVEFSEISPQEVTISCTVSEKEVILPVSTLSLPIQSLENTSTVENDTTPHTTREERDLVHTQHTPKTPSEQPTVSSELETGSDLSVSSHPPPITDDKVVSQEEDSTPVVIKRSRGRPRKSATPQQTKKADDETPKCTEKLLGDQITSPSPLSGVRKSERVRKRKFGSDEIEKTDIKEKVSTHIEQYEKTGRRGRPRKYPRIEKDENTISEPKTDEANLKEIEKQPLPLNDKVVLCEIPDTPCNTARGRRGRPRREKSEAEIIKNICDEPDIHKPPSVDKPADKDKREIKLSAHTTQNGENEKSENEKDAQILPVFSDPSSLSEKRLILPLKKRKKIEEKINSVSSPKRESTHSIYEISVQKEVIAERKVTSDKREKDARFKMEKRISASLQTSPTRAENDLLEKVPELDKSRYPYQKIECAPHTYIDTEIYPTLKPNVKEYKVFSNKHAWKEYLAASISIKINTTCNWMKLECFDSVSLDDSKSAMFFTGGPVQSSAFCPIPSHMDQYIAVASSDMLYNRRRQCSLSYVDAKNEKGLIQFYNLGCLQSNRLNRLPCMKLALEHQHGVITEMKWCPKGCFDLPLSSDGVIGSRLGLLALSCSDSYIRIYSVPHPDILPKKDGNACIYNTNPSLVLTPLFSEPCSVTRRSIATCLDWHRNTEVIAAGYGNGCICVWMVKIISAPSSTIVTVKNEDKSLSILPYLVFDASGTPVTSISFAPLDSCQYLVSSSFDKTLKFFDLRDTSMPFCSIKRGFALDDCKWNKGFCGALVSLHDGIIFKGSSFAKECGIEEFPIQNIAGTVGSLTCSAISDITDMQAIADMTGTVSINFFHSSCDQIKQPSFDTHIIFETEVVTLGQDVKMSLDEVVNSEVSSVLNDTMDIVEVVMEKFAKYCEYNSSDNRHKGVVLNSDKVEESIRHCHEPDLIDLMNNLLESVIAIGASKKSVGEERASPAVFNSEDRRLDQTIENKEMPHVSSGDAKGTRHFPSEEMLNSTLPIHKNQFKHVTRNLEELNISDQLNMPSLLPTDDSTLINNSVNEDSLPSISAEDVPSNFSKDLSCKNTVESDCGILLQNCVESVCDIMLHWCVESKFKCNSLPQQSGESKSDSNAVVQQSIKSECNVVPLQAVELECSIVPQRSFESKCNNVPQQLVESECNVAKESVESEFSFRLSLDSNSKVQQPLESESSVCQSLESESNVRSSLESESSVQPPFESDSSVRPSLESDSSVRPSLESDSSVRPSLESDSSVRPSLESDSSVRPSLESDSSVRPSLESDSSVRPSLESDSSVRPSLESDSSVRPSLESDSSVRPSLESDSSVRPSLESDSSVRPSLESDSSVRPSLESDSIVRPSLESESIVPPSLESESIVRPSLESESIVPLSLESESIVPLSLESETIVPLSLESESIVPQSLESESSVRQSLESESSVVQHSVDSECSVAQHSVDSECSVAQHSVDSECSVVQHSVDSECSVVQHSVDSECSVVQHSVDSECSVAQHSVDSECSVAQHSLGPECSVAQQSVEFECTAAQQTVELENNNMPLENTISECVAVRQSTEAKSSVPQSTKSECNTAVQKSIESDYRVELQLKSADSSDISNHGEESDDSLSMISECSYASDSCDSIPSFLSDAPDTPSESPIPIHDKEEFLSLDTPSDCPIPIDDGEEFLSQDTPSDCPIPIDDKEEFLSPDTPSEYPIPVDDNEKLLLPVSSFIKNISFSEQSSLPLEENCSSQETVAEDSVFGTESSVENTEELECNEMPITNLSTENELENCVPKNVESGLESLSPHTQTSFSDTPQTLDSNSKPECLLEEQKCDSVVPNFLLSDESDHIQTINGKSSPTNSNDSVHMLESDTVKELSSPDLFYEPQYPQTSRQFLENVSSSEGTTERDAYNSEERSKELLLGEDSPVSYASIISTCGLIFKDVNTIRTSSDFEKKDSLPIESNVLSSVNAISWNPNYGCHFWLVTAGNSGVARLICVSELSPQENTSPLDKESTM
ncbi:unnamed protein product [Larinioides sclopetarius]|uniref:General transcription factor 3C polypeptide 2 n=1 Tax=Larinioides sclopetarius TaxID=280406 RepID=A0AAV1YY00_9ARAC